VLGRRAVQPQRDRVHYPLAAADRVGHQHRPGPPRREDEHRNDRRVYIATFRGGHADGGLVLAVTQPRRYVPGLDARYRVEHRQLERE